ncbi:MAG: MerR family transcriptional regulator [Micrococcales bacterium]|jgi:DNA-binding transcriptional MerR regulator|nr:MerR family transcriptional regulator [Micrococcales bacterium]MBT5398256.1 MerR family transcriptional regulator [Micrococcales bacterium]MBT7926474.1 MerR family transcriptional regulator [Micrococcales bacterium]
MESALSRLQDHRRLYTIGQVLAVLKPEFGDLSPSKLRFLEDQGLVAPERTESGYRKFSDSQIERLRVILTLQRDQYLPLKVIRDHLEELDAGRQPLLPTATPASLRKGQRFSTAQLKLETGLSDAGFREGAELGLFGAQPHSSHEVEIAFALVGLEEFGIQPRHLRGLKSAAEREIGIITGVTEPVLRKKAPDSAAKAGHISREIAERFGAIRSHLIAEVIEEIES